MRVEEVVRRIAHAGKGAAAGIGEGLEIGEQRIGRQRRARADRDLVGAARGALDQAVAADGHDIGVVARAARECRRDAAIGEAVVVGAADDACTEDADQRVGRRGRAVDRGEARVGRARHVQAGARAPRIVNVAAAAAAGDRVRAGGVEERVVAAGAGERVVQRVAGDTQAGARHAARIDILQVGEGRRRDIDVLRHFQDERVGAGATVDLRFGAVPGDGIVGRAANDGIRAAVAVDGIVAARRADDRVGGGGGDDVLEIVDGVAVGVARRAAVRRQIDGDGRCGRRIIERVGATAPVEAVGTGAAADRLVARAAEDGVGIGAAHDGQDRRFDLVVFAIEDVVDVGGGE